MRKYARKAPILGTALWEAGLSAIHAHEISNAMYIHQGKQMTDYTTKNMRLITPENAQILFQSVQLQPPESWSQSFYNPLVPRPPEEDPNLQTDPLPPPSGPLLAGTGNNPGEPSEDVPSGIRQYS